MKRMNQIRCGLLLRLGVVFCLFASGCNAKEEVLFLEVQSSISETEAYESSIAEEETEDKKCIVVHICGAVQKPGVYELEAGSRVMDAVTAAGGFLPEADTEYVNLATCLSDGNKVRIPTKDESIQMSYAGEETCDIGVISSQGVENTGENGTVKVNINTADEELLCTLPGIGQTRARSILEYRAEHGAFLRIEDIMQVSGIKENSFQKIKEYITIK